MSGKPKVRVIGTIGHIGRSSAGKSSLIGTLITKMEAAGVEVVREGVEPKDQEVTDVWIDEFEKIDSMMMTIRPCPQIEEFHIEKVSKPYWRRERW